MWSFARSAVRVHRASLAGSALVVALAAALLTTTGVWVEAGVRSAAGSADPEASMLIAAASSFAGTAIIIALLVVGSTFTAALRPRAREFALLRAVGATTAQVRRLVTDEVLLVFAVAAPLGTLPGLLLAPRLTGTLADGGILPDGFTPQTSVWPVLGALVLLVPTALLAARMAGRESARLSPAGAVRQSAVEPRVLSRGRRTTAVALAVAGLVVAGVPFAVPGLLGSAAATTSAFLLIGAAALAGPLLVGAVARRGLALRLGRPRPVTTLALTNARGFSRRLSGATVPLALLLALGTVQSGTNTAVVDAAGRQVRDSLTADLVVQGPSGVDQDAVAAIPGVAATEVTSVVPAQVKVDQDDEDLSFLEGLSWEAVPLRTVDPGARMVDPDVRAGSLADLAGERTIAVSREAADTGMAAIGDPVGVRVDGVEQNWTIVAVYERGLGLGDYLVGSGALAAFDGGADGSADGSQAGSAAASEAGSGGDAQGATLLVRLDDGADPAAVREAVTAAGMTVTDVDGYAASVRDAAQGQQGLSAVLLLALLAFVAVAAANTLLMLVGSRRGELALLRRTGATRRQVIAMVAAESVLATATALVVGTACVLPALLGVGQGLLGVPLPVMDLRVYGGLAAAVVVIGAVLPVLAAVRATAGSRGTALARA